jgi:two-component system cell cycle response regulator
MVLKKFSHEISKNTRPDDFVGRYGGEEFVMSLSDTDIGQAVLIAERMRLHTEGIQFILPKNIIISPISVTASFGVASLRLNPDESIDSIIKRADEALYKAKA